MSNFEFINTEGSKPKVPPSARRAARIHVMRKYHSDKRNKNKPPAASRQEPNTAQPLTLPLRSSPRPQTPQQSRPTLNTVQGHHSNASNLYHNGVLAPSIGNVCPGCRRLRLPNQGPLVPESSFSRQCTCMHLTIPSGLEPAPQSSFHIEPALVTLLQFCEFIVLFFSKLFLS